MARGPKPKTEKQRKALREIVDLVREHESPKDFMHGIISGLPCEAATSLPSEWATENRFLTSTATPFPGRWSWDRSPWFREVVDHLSPHTPTQRVAVMKATQIGYTAAVIENAMGFIISSQPAPTLYVTGNEDLIAAAKKTRIDPMIDSSGLRKRIQAGSTERRGIKRTGDTKGMMEFLNGFIKMCGPNTESSFQGISYKALLLDEIDLYPPKLGNSGETVKVIEARADAFGHKKKILYGSRPTVSFGIAEQQKNDEEGIKRDEKQVGSRILDLYNTGDKRKYHVPCPLCGGKQELVFFNGVTAEGVKYGLSFDSSACREGDFSSIEYLCRHCGEGFKEYHKSKIVLESSGAEWVPTCKAKEPDFVSYQISSMYSLTATWQEMVIDYLGSIGDPAKIQIFYNRFLGLPFEDRGGKLDVTKLSENTGSYMANDVPDGVLFLTAAADVQRKGKGRIEVEIRGWGRNHRSWGIDYRVIHAEHSVEDKHDRCWTELAQIVDETWGPKEMQVERMFLDSGDGSMTSTIYDVCRMHGQGDAALMLPLKGLALTARTRVDFMVADLPSERFPLIEIYVDKYKNKLANRLKQDWREGEGAPLGWTMFPMSHDSKAKGGYNREYFRQLGNEEKVLIRNGPVTIVKWVSKGRNEAWDILVYGTCCAEFVLQDYSIAKLHLEKSNANAVWEYFEADLLDTEE